MHLKSFDLEITFRYHHHESLLSRLKFWKVKENREYFDKILYEGVCIYVIQKKLLTLAKQMRCLEKNNWVGLVDIKFVKDGKVFTFIQSANVKALAENEELFCEEHSEKSEQSEQSEYSK